MSKHEKSAQSERLFSVSEMFGVTGAADEVEALAVALFCHRCPGIRMTDEDLHYYGAAASRAFQAVRDELDTPDPSGFGFDAAD